MYLRAHNEKSSLIDCPRFRHLINRLHALGPRPMGEFIAALHRRADLPVVDLLERHASNDPATVRALGADRWPPAVILVPDSIRSGLSNLDTILRCSLQPADGGDAA